MKGNNFFPLNKFVKKNKQSAKHITNNNDTTFSWMTLSPCIDATTTSYHHDDGSIVSTSSVNFFGWFYPWISSGCVSWCSSRRMTLIVSAPLYAISTIFYARGIGFYFFGDPSFVTNCFVYRRLIASAFSFVLWSAYAKLSPVCLSIAIATTNFFCLSMPIWTFVGFASATAVDVSRPGTSRRLFPFSPICNC